MRRSLAWQLGSTIPKIIALFFVADVGLRFVPIDLLTFRGWEAMTRWPTADGPFEPNKCYRNGRTHGDLANMGNLPAPRDYRSETFTSDAYGFRNSPGAFANRPPDALLFGTSFSVGAGVSDDETLAAQLGARAAGGVYNASGVDADPAFIRWLARDLGMSRGVVFCEHLERFDLPLVPPPGEAAEVVGASGLILPKGEDGKDQGRTRLKQWLKDKAIFQPLRLAWRWWNVSPLEILASRACRSLQDGRLLPNPFRRRVEVRTLRNGDLMIFPRQYAEPAPEARRADLGAAYWAWVAEELKKDDLTLVVLLVPEKYTVYRTLLAEPPPDPQGPAFLERLEKELGDRGVPVVNLTPALRRQAAASLDREEYTYWRDDTHWNPRGIGVAAEEICRSRQFP